ncbi:Protein kinase domain-containing protein [Cinnamomum micranthum f. kanehirae]|uniref:Protein kinase domain-containing protein n=1 Tax=Cinnamomum micranthum f. kanehirae TaxID=337451 RepID=A0A443N7T8_9MAGN|nr:Protein kinase domain-containing protein [Cinnamomum micranthum f. kanehirae]
MALHWLVHLFLWCLSLATISSSSSTMKCQRRCGKISIPFPFGMGDRTCFRNEWFNVTCDESVTPPKALLGHNDLVGQEFEVLDISLEGHLKTKKEIIHDCRSKSYNDSDNNLPLFVPLFESPYTFSNTRNKFTAVGCNTLAYMTGYTPTSSLFRVGCISNCYETASVTNGSYSCTGIGCCQTSIPPGIVGFKVGISRVSDQWNSCSYAFLADQDFNLKVSVFNLSKTSFLDRNKRVPVVLDWVASQNETCEEATDYACLSENSICYNSTNGSGYSCKCSPGYQGNPYIHGGCIDIDECKNKTSHNCNQMCINMPGSYHCKCRKGYHGDGWNNGTRCTADAKEFPVVKVILGEKAVCLNRSHEDRNLAMYFVREMKENRLFQMLDERVRSEASVEQLMAIAQLTLRCLKLNGEKRPTMKEVVVDLQGLRGFQNHHSIHDQETEKKLCETSQGCKEDAGGQYSVFPLLIFLYVCDLTHSEGPMASHWFVVVLCCLSSFSFYSSSSMNPNCKTTCGNINIPYPFGMGEDPTCFRHSMFNITCNESSTPPKALLSGQEVLDISLQGQLRIKFPIGWDCYSESGNRTDYDSGLSFDTNRSPYTFSNTRNIFTAIGCDTQAYVKGNPYVEYFSKKRDDHFRFGCMSSCWNTTSVTNGSCTGIGCCQSVIPANLKMFGVDIESFNNHTDVWSFNPCSYAFFVDQDFNLNFSVSDLSNTSFRDRNGQVPVVLDWVVVWNKTCQEATRNKTDCACLSENSECSDSTNGPGYRCNCSAGYQGNPYVPGGCKDIDECKDKKTHNCKQMCINMPGDYHCKCREGYHGDGWNNGTGCTAVAYAKEFPVLKVILGTGLSLLFLLIASTWIYWLWRKRRSMKLKEKFFHQNGGLMLQQKISTHRSDAFKIFTIEELERATNNYDASTIVGQGGFGIVYKGVLPNNRIVAIKKSKLVDASQIDQFINELDILSQVNHKNVVKLLGCCLEDQVPILVYEFISNGTLYHHIHEAGQLPSISLENRLRIATEIAEALAYLHSDASMPIFHRDIKSANILVDNDFTVKVADFGVSRLVPIDHTQITTLVHGTWGYLDPECLQTGKLTDKSDVYSFGVVLLELLTGEKVVCLNRSHDDRNLATYFVRVMKENRLFQVLEERVRSEASVEQLMAIAQLALRCLKLKGEKRPTMKKVVVDLQALRGLQNHPSVHDQETEKLLCETSQDCTEDTGGQYSIRSHFDISLTLSR